MLCDNQSSFIYTQLTKSTSNVIENARTREKMIVLLKEHERCSEEVRQHRGNINELDFLLKQVQKEIKGLKNKGTGCEIVSIPIKVFRLL